MTACYITSSFPAFLVFAYKYGQLSPEIDRAEEILLASANAGGENVARGALLGALYGAAMGYDGISTPLKTGLYSSHEYEQDIYKFVDIYVR
jgi:ADP-ribosyl-[dinitrogen reductase] hydrolase